MVDNTGNFDNAYKPSLDYKPKTLTDYSLLLVSLKQKIKWLDDESPHVMVAITTKYWREFSAVAQEVTELGILLGVLADNAVAKLERVQQNYEGK